MSSKRKNTPTKLAKEDGSALERHIFNSAASCNLSVAAAAGASSVLWGDSLKDPSLYDGGLHQLDDDHDAVDNDNNNVDGRDCEDSGSEEPPAKQRRVSQEDGENVVVVLGGEAESNDLDVLDTQLSDSQSSLVNNETNNNNNNNNNNTASANGVVFPPSAKSTAVSSQRKSMESVLRRLNSRTADNPEVVDSGKMYNSVHAVLAADSSLHEKEQQISDMIAQLQNIKENLNRQKAEVGINMISIHCQELS